MNILIDTQCFLWAFLEPERLREEAKQALADWSNTLFLSAVSAWEISIKYGIGKLYHLQQRRGHAQSFVDATYTGTVTEYDF